MLDLSLVERGLAVPVDRGTLAAQTDDLARAVAARIGRCLAQADLAPERIDALFLTGGSTGLPHLRAAGGGSMVNLASAAGLTPRPNYSAYGASKGGLIMFTRSLALELAAENIRANAVCPGAIETPMLAATIADANEAAILARYALRRFGTAEEVANLVLFLTSSEASYVTGAAYTVDGGSVFH